jgi:hypothetical protein
MKWAALDNGLPVSRRYNGGVALLLKNENSSPCGLLRNSENRYK